MYPHIQQFASWLSQFKINSPLRSHSAVGLIFVVESALTVEQIYHTWDCFPWTAANQLANCFIRYILFPGSCAGAPSQRAWDEALHWTCLLNTDCYLSLTGMATSISNVPSSHDVSSLGAQMLYLNMGIEESWYDHQERY